MPVFLIMLQVRIKLCWVKFKNLCAQLFPPPITEEVPEPVYVYKASPKKLKTKKATMKKKPAKVK